MPTDEQVEELANVLEVLGFERQMSYSLADAIREGCQGTDQAIGAWENDNHDLCALQTALLAVKARRMV